MTARSKTPQGHTGAFLLPIVGHLTILQVKLVDESLSIKEVTERLVSHLEKTWTHPEKAAAQPCWQNAYRITHTTSKHRLILRPFKKFFYS